MRILQVISGLGIGGAERQLVLLSRALRRRGHRVLIYTLNAHTPRLRELDGAGVEVLIDQKRLRFDPWVLTRLRRTARRWGADLAHGWLYDGNVYARVALRGTGIPVITSDRCANHPLTLLQGLGYALTRGWEAALVANSWAALEAAGRLHGLPAERTHVVWNGIDLEQVAREARAAPALRAALWPGEETRIACLVGSITPRKDQLLALATAAALHARDARWRFVFVGDARLHPGPYTQVVQARARALRLEPVCRFAGERSDAIAHIAASDVLFSTSRFEGFPNVVLEAMACGVPVASTEYSDIRRILPLPWQVVAARRPELLADAIQRAALEHRALAVAQRAWVARHATVERMAGAMSAVYARYAARRAPRPARAAPAADDAAP